MQDINYFIKFFGEQYPISHALWRTFEAAALSKFDLKFPLLDLGCGDGFFLETILGAAPRGQVFGVDLSEPVTKKARARGLYANVECADARNMPFEDNFFECIFSNSVIEHIPNLDSVLSQIARVLKPGGTIIFSAPTDMLGKYFFWRRFGEKIAMRRFAEWYNTKVNKTFVHHNLLSAEEWGARLGAHGLTLKDAKHTLGTSAEKMWDLLLPASYAQRAVKQAFETRRIPLASANTKLLSYFVSKMKDEEEACASGGNCVMMAVKAG